VFGTPLKPQAHLLYAGQAGKPAKLVLRARICQYFIFFVAGNVIGLLAGNKALQSFGYFHQPVGEKVSVSIQAFKDFNPVAHDFQKIFHFPYLCFLHLIGSIQSTEDTPLCGASSQKNKKNIFFSFF
jgi:hypothetical protein